MEFTQHLLNNTAEGIMVFNGDLNCIFWNRAMEIYSGINSFEITGRSIFDLFPHMSHDGGDELLALALKGEKTKTGYFLYIKRAGEEEKWIKTFFGPYYNRNNQIIGIVGYARESDNHRTAFLRNLSHEVRTPMNAIVGFCQVLENSPDIPPSLQKYIQYIVTNSNDLLNIINQLLEASMLETGQLKLDLQKCDANDLLNELYIFFSNYKKQVGKHNLNLFLKQIPEDIQSTIITDIPKVKRILINIIHNAIKFTTEGSVEFGVRSLDGNTITFYVKDTGTGIPKEKQEIIFDYPSTPERMTSSSYHGLGLGLTTVKGLVTFMDGKVWVETNKNGGSSFYFSIPVTLPKDAPSHNHLNRSC